MLTTTDLDEDAFELSASLAPDPTPAVQLGDCLFLFLELIGRGLLEFHNPFPLESLIQLNAPMAKGTVDEAGLIALSQQTKW